ncbi:MAG: methanogenesis marker protein Mmp4/MtxX [Promethearchaeota archaeon]
MNILQIFRSLAKTKSEIIGIGFGESEFHNKKILEACISHLKEFNSKILIFGKKQYVDSIQLKDIAGFDINFIKSNDPELNIFEFLNENKVGAIVRGSLSSRKFLENFKRILKIDETYRLALLETYNGHQFFYGPVGIDECNNLETKLRFLKYSINEFKTLGIIPKISILSGGRKSDIGRDSRVDESIKIADKIVEDIKEKFQNLEISHDEILIENAINNKSNLILAPDGISGNLIYRTLVHLGGGKAYGAIYMGLKDIIIDTSRVGKVSEIQGALLLALALTK